MRVQLPTENLTFHEIADDHPIWREGNDESEESRVATNIAISQAFRDATHLVERMIRERAYQLWDRAGRPEGHSDEFWFTAHAAFERNSDDQLAEFRRHQLTRAFGDVSEAMDAGT